MPILPSHAPSLSLALVLLTAAGARAGVTVVAPTGGEFTTIDAALAAVPEGEILLVRTGTYPAFTIASKSVHVVADAGAQVVVDASVTVVDLASNQPVTLQGLRILKGPFQSAPGLSVIQCSGAVRANAIRIDTVAPGLGVTAVPPAARVQSSLDVALEQCTLRGVPGAPAFPGFPTAAPTPALHIVASKVAIHGGEYTGGDGQSGLPSNGISGPTPGHPGAEGLRVEASSTLFVQGARITGGTGGSGADAPSCIDLFVHPTSGGDGGAALSSQGPNSITALDPLLAGGVGGPGGTGPGCTWPNGADGAHVLGGPLATLTGSARSMRVVEPTREGATVQLHFEGVPGDQVFLAFAAGRQHAFEPILNGTLHVLPPFRRARLGMLDGSGMLDVALPVGELGPGIEGVLRQVQGIFVDVGGTRWLSGVGTATMLDASL